MFFFSSCVCFTLLNHILILLHKHFDLVLLRFAFRHEEKFWSTKYIPEFCDKEKQYQLEISQYKNTIKELTDSQRDRNDLRRNNEMLQEELAKIKNEKEALMTTSVAVCEGKLKRCIILKLY